MLGGAEIKTPRVFLVPEAQINDQIILDWRTSHAVGYGRIEFRRKTDIIFEKSGFYVTMCAEDNGGNGDNNENTPYKE